MGGFARRPQIQMDWSAKATIAGQLKSVIEKPGEKMHFADPNNLRDLNGGVAHSMAT